MSNYGESYYPEEVKEPIYYRLSADVNVEELFGFIIENLPYKKVLRLKFLLNASVKDKENITLKEAEALSKIFSWYKDED